MRKTGCFFTVLSGIFIILIPVRLIADVKIWTCDVLINENNYKAAKELKPIVLIGARNGTLSGKVIVETTEVIKGLKASAGNLTGKVGEISVKNVQVRYGKEWDIPPGWLKPEGTDVLAESAPETAPVKGKPVLIPVCVTVKVPKDAKAGIYNGSILVQLPGSLSVNVKLNLEVVDWTLPDPQDYRTWIDFMQSPDTLAVEYKLPLWSEKHWEMIDRSFELISPTGARTLYVPLICRTNFGNEQSMVRWIKKGEKKYEYDYTVLDRYLDSAEKNLGKPKLVVFLVWDICMSMDSLKRGIPTYFKDEAKIMTEARTALLGKGPRVTAFDPATKETGNLTLPRYEDPESKTLWQPVFTEIIKRMKKRGLEKTMMLGIMPDLWPNKEEVAFWKDVSGGLPWAIHGHSGAAKDVMIGNKGLYKISDIGYAAFVYNLVYNVNPEKGRMYGWQNPALLTAYERGGMLNRSNPIEIRELLAFDITGGQRGGGRMGADYWPVLKNKKGERTGAVVVRYPENNWRNLDICDWFLAPGSDGALGTVRLEMLKEGAQVCEARIFLEESLLDNAKKSKLGAELAKRCQDTLDELQHAMWKTVWSVDEDLKKIGVAGENRYPLEGLYNALKKAGKDLPPFQNHHTPLTLEQARKGQEWYVAGWQEREKKLFSLAGETANIIEGNISGKAARSSFSTGVDYPEVISKNTGIAKEKVLELSKNPGISNDDILVICSAAEITKGNISELYKKRKKVNTNYEFINNLNLEKEEKAAFDALLKKLKAEVNK